MKKRMQIISALLLSISLLLPSNTAFSRDSYFSDLFTSTIWQLHVMADLGENNVDNLTTFRDRTRFFFDDAIAEFDPDSGYVPGGVDDDKKDPFYAKPLIMEKAQIMEDLDERIALARKREQQAKEDREDYQDYPSSVIFVIHAVLTAGADSVNENTPAGPNSVIAKILPVLQKQIKQNATDMFYGHIASQIPDSGSVIASISPSQTYHVDAGLPASSAPPVVAQDDTPTVEPSAPTLVPTIVSVENNENTSGSYVNILKPLRFTNKGLYDATVLVASYTPAAGVTAGMSSASTVVFRESNPSAYLDLPLGTYVFCYYWDLGTDVDNDGYVDYAHRNTGSVTLSGAPSDNTTSAQVVTLSPENMNNPNGKCGVTPPVEDAGELTPQELANQGTHTYNTSCDADEFGSEAMVGTFIFAADGVKVTVDDETDFYQRIDINTYDFTKKNADQSGYAKITFTDLGFTSLYIFEGVLNGTINCTSVRK